MSLLLSLLLGLPGVNPNYRHVGRLWGASQAHPYGPVIFTAEVDDKATEYRFGVEVVYPTPAPRPWTPLPLKPPERIGMPKVVQ